MKLLTAQIKNYKCFIDSGEICFASGFNIFIGQNDAGKSALLDALSTRITHVPHRSLASAPHAHTADDPQTTVDCTYAVSAEDLQVFFSQQKAVSLPVQIGSAGNRSAETTIACLTDALKNGSEFKSTWIASGQGVGLAPSRSTLHALSAMNPDGEHLQFNNKAFPSGVDLSLTYASGSPTYGAVLAPWLAQNIYAFRAERFSISRSTHQGGEALASNASNLPEVVNILQTKYTHKWKKYLGHVRSIFPHIHEVKAVSKGGGQVEIWISNTDPALDRTDLDVSLADSGTGIGQVLAILYVVVHNLRPHTILIDEPQSFLHPGALRKLLEILRTYDQHQYILTTHSPLSLALSEADRVFQVVRSEEGSKIKPVNEREDLISALSDVGARLGDVYGAESVLWVEGPTEERCFPEIIRGISKRPLQGAVIIGVIATGDLENKRDAKRVCEIYSRLTNSNALLPKPLAFVFDREGRDEQTQKEIAHRLSGLMEWLPMRMYENYLLVPDAIAHVLNEIRNGETPLITNDQIQSWLETNGGESKYFDASEAVAYGHEKWRGTVHGAKILEDVFFSLTRDTGAYEYEKVTHGVLLTRYLIANPTEDIRELSTFLTGLLERQD